MYLGMFLVYQIYLNRFESFMQKLDQYHDFIILGAGISGLQAGLILAEHEKDFIILEATNVVGGRIGTQTLGQVIIKQSVNPNSSFQNLSPRWIKQDPDVLQIPIEYGATWIGTNHDYMKKLCKQLDIQYFPQYNKGSSLYGLEPGSFVPFEHLYPQQTRQVIDAMLVKLDKLKQKFNQLYEQAIQKQYPDKKKLYEQFVRKYDVVSVKQFIQTQIKNHTLAEQLMGFIQCLQCIDCGKFSLLQLIYDQDSLAIVEEFTYDPHDKILGRQEADDGFRIKTGTLSIIKAMVQKMQEFAQEYLQKEQISKLIRFNQPIFHIQAPSDKNKLRRIQTKTANGIKTYQCKRILNGIPLATLSTIQIDGLSKGKQIIFNGQEMGIVYRVYMVFSQPFWRKGYSGYGAFSPRFAFNEMTDISPQDNSAGILAFVFYADRYRKWQQQIPSPAYRFQYIKKVVADMFLKGDINNQFLQQCITYTRTFTYHEYIKAAYQPTTKIGIWKAVQESGDYYAESFSRDQNGIYYIGSQFDEEFGSYMQGSIRITRRKVYQLISKADPWRQ